MTRWYFYYAFEREAGKEEKQKAVKERCVVADPKHGEIWCSIMKDMKHRKKSAAEGLELASRQIMDQKQQILIS